ncbi:MAG: leucyl/phenylalanyl-tRNA--protein transferase, partial [Prevotella sp.]|nr:leucyl/phenylalanyl-tRNA--protein transferase [Prevotella sp.]
MIFQLDENLWFPDPHDGEPDGLIAIGGDLSIDRLLLAYYYGIFPWYSFRHAAEPYWYCPLQRFVIFPDEIHVS